MAPNCATYVELGLGLGEAHLVGGVDKEDDAAHLREVVLPQPPGWATGRTGTFGQRDGPGGGVPVSGERGGCERVRAGWHVPCWWPPRSYVVKRTVPIVSSSDAACMCPVRVHAKSVRNP